MANTKKINFKSFTLIVLIYSLFGVLIRLSYDIGLRGTGHYGYSKAILQIIFFYFWSFSPKFLSFFSSSFEIKDRLTPAINYGYFIAISIFPLILNVYSAQSIERISISIFCNFNAFGFWHIISKI